MQSIVRQGMLPVCVRSLLSSGLRYTFLILNTLIRALYVREQGCENSWLIFRSHKWSASGNIWGILRFRFRWDFLKALKLLHLPKFIRIPDAITFNCCRYYFKSGHEHHQCLDIRTKWMTVDHSEHDFDCGDSSCSKRRCLFLFWIKGLIWTLKSWVLFTGVVKCVLSIFFRNYTTYFLLLTLFCGPRSFITAFISTSHCYVSWAITIQATTDSPYYLRSV
jgi:hypothetical protein